MIKINSADSINLTTVEIGEMFGIEYSAAAGLVRFLSAQNLAKEVGKRPSKSGKGKASIIYNMPAEFTVTLGDIP